LSAWYGTNNVARKRDLNIPSSNIASEAPQRPNTSRLPGRFEFERDTFAFANELLWEYHFDAATGKTTYCKRIPKPAYAHRCFVVARAARQFFYHARFLPEQSAPDDAICRRLIRQVLARNPRAPSAPDERLKVPGYTGLRQLSAEREALMKSECGGAWRSYVLRSHWRMVFPISRAHQARTATDLGLALREGRVPIIHLVRFPKLSINHGMVVYAAERTSDGASFLAYDPNDIARPATLSFTTDSSTFFLPTTRYWPGGRVDVIEIYRRWWL
jgi:hypothetical protein